MPKFRTKPVVVEAKVLTQGNIRVLAEWMGNDVAAFTPNNEGLHIQTLDGIMFTRFGDWIIKGAKGEFYPCKPGIFEATYQPALDDAAKRKEKEEPVFDINDRGFNVRAWYLKNDEELKLNGDSLVEIRYDGELVREFTYPSYKIWNIAAHFSDIVDGELSKDDKERGYLIAGAMGFGGYVLPKPLPT